jgi:hypothetical protein
MRKYNEDADEFPHNEDIVDPNVNNDKYTSFYGAKLE